MDNGFFISGLLLLQLHVLSAQEVHVKFLTAVPRLHSNTTKSNINTTDYYFSCNVVGRFLQWQYNHEPLTGFLIRDMIGKVIVDKRLDYTYTATLLSSQPTNNNQAKMDSVLVMSFPTDTDPGYFNITCSSNHIINSTTAGIVNHVNKHDENGEIQLDYVISDRVVSNDIITHMFICGVENGPLFFETSEHTIEFIRFDHVGQTKNVLSEDGNTMSIQRILITREVYLIVSLIFITTSSNVVNVSCFNNMSNLFLLSQEIEKSTVNVAKTTHTISEAFANLTGSSGENTTQAITLSQFNNSISPILFITLMICSISVTVTTFTVSAFMHVAIIRHLHKIDNRSGNTTKSACSTFHGIDLTSELFQDKGTIKEKTRSKHFIVSPL